MMGTSATLPVMLALAACISATVVIGANLTADYRSG